MSCSITESLISHSTLEVAGIQKGGILSTQYPQKSEGKDLKIIVQPETQHRARYLTEGSRGSVKDRTQQGFPTVKVRIKFLVIIFSNIVQLIVKQSV